MNLPNCLACTTTQTFLSGAMVCRTPKGAPNTQIAPLNSSTTGTTNNSSRNASPKTAGGVAAARQGNLSPLRGAGLNASTNNQSQSEPPSDSSTSDVEGGAIASGLKTGYADDALRAIY